MRMLSRDPKLMLGASLDHLSTVFIEEESLNGIPELADNN